MCSNQKTKRCLAPAVRWVPLLKLQRIWWQPGGWYAAACFGAAPGCDLTFRCLALWTMYHGTLAFFARFLWHSSLLQMPVNNVLWNPCFFRKFSVTFVTVRNVSCKVWPQLHRCEASMSNYLWHSSLFQTRLVKYDYSYTYLKRQCPIPYDIRHFSERVR